MFSVFKIGTALAFAGQVSAMIFAMEGFPSDENGEDEANIVAFPFLSDENGGDGANREPENESSKNGMALAFEDQVRPLRPAVTPPPVNALTTAPPVVTRTGASSEVVSDRAWAEEQEWWDNMFGPMEGVDDVPRRDAEHKEITSRDPIQTQSHAELTSRARDDSLSPSFLLLKASKSVSSASKKEAHIGKTPRTGTS